MTSVETIKGRRSQGIGRKSPKRAMPTKGRKKLGSASASPRNDRSSKAPREKADRTRMYSKCWSNIEKNNNREEVSRAIWKLIRTLHKTSKQRSLGSHHFLCAKGEIDIPKKLEWDVGIPSKNPQAARAAGKSSLKDQDRYHHPSTDSNIARWRCLLPIADWSAHYKKWRWRVFFPEIRSVASHSKVPSRNKSGTPKHKSPQRHQRSAKPEQTTSKAMPRHPHCYLNLGMKRTSTLKKK